MLIRLNVVSGRGAPEQIDIEALGVAEAREEAERRGYYVLGAAMPAFAGAGSMGRGRPAGRFDMAVFVEQLRDLLVAGLSVIEALQTLQAGATNYRQRTEIETLAAHLRSGLSLSDALSRQAVFPALLVALVKASELTSNLPEGLERFLDHQRRVSELRHRISSIAIYPLVVTAVGALVLLFLTLYVMPRFARVFEGMTGELPWSARAMIWWAHWLHAHGTVLLLAVCGLAAVAAAYLGSATARRHALQRLLDLGPLRLRLRTYFLARWYRATGMLVEGGIPLTEALALASHLLPDAMKPMGLAVEKAVREGQSPSDAHILANMATPVAEQLMRAGERTGDFGGVLTRIAHFHESEITRSLEKSMRTLEPIVMTMIGVGVGVLVVLMYLPIFELASVLQ